MTDTNLVLLKGRIGSDPEIRTAGQNTLVARMRVVTNKRRNTGGQWNEVPTWHTVKAFGAVAEQLEGTLRKGSRVIIHGELNVYNYTRRDGSRGCEVEIVAETIALDGTPLRRQPQATRRNENYADRRPASAPRSAPPPRRPQSEYAEQFDDELPADPFETAPRHEAYPAPPPPRTSSPRTPAREEARREPPPVPEGVATGEEDPFGHYSDH